jgi:receptor protein-tyrosine kinase
MDDKNPDLIARAAARIREAGKLRSTIERAAERATEISGPGVPIVSAEPAIAPAPAPVPPSRRSKVVAVDRGALARAGVSVDGGARTRTSEEFRIIKRQIVLNALREPNLEEGERSGRLIMVTSARPREGKTFTSVNLALSLASERDFRVLLIDADVHRQSLAQFFGVSATSGWVDLLMGEPMDFADVLLRTNLHNLTLLPAGKPGADVPELLSSKRMASLVNEMARRYSDRFIIFDAPPCLASSDPSILAGLVGQVVFVVEAHRTQREEIESGLRLVSGCSNINLLLNKADVRTVEEFGSYSEYYGSTSPPS